MVAILVLAVVGWTGLDDAMTPFEAVSHALSVIALGGFSTQNESAAAFVPLTQYLLLLFMILAGVNFLRLYRLLVQRQVAVVRTDEELRLYGAFLVLGSALIIVELLAGDFARGEEAIRTGMFQAVAIMSTTGFGTADYTQWGPLAVMTLLLLMFVGASAGSTGGSIKVVRHLLLFKLVKRELDSTIHREIVPPDHGQRRRRRGALAALDGRLRAALPAHVRDRRAGAAARRRASAACELTAFEAIGASAACIGNVGPAFGFAGPFGSYEPMSDLSTGILTALMWLGRMEIIPVAVLLSRNYWRG